MLVGFDRSVGRKFASIVRFYGAYKLPDACDTYVIVMRREKHDMRNPRLSGNALWRVIFDVANALDIIHCLSYFHGDVKPANMLVYVHLVVC